MSDGRHRIPRDQPVCFYTINYLLDSIRDHIGIIRASCERAYTLFELAIRVAPSASIILPVESGGPLTSFQ
jgi:hypothetical protein